MLDGPNLYNSKAQQIALRLMYERLDVEDFRKTRLQDYGFRVFSQHDEDGILHYIFSVIGEGNRSFVELGCGTGYECNTANLTINHSWHGLLVDGSQENVDTARAFYSKVPDSRFFPPQIVQSFIEPDNVNALLAQHGFGGELDLFSLDIDGVDWWVWEALTQVNPRVVILETPTIWGPDDSFTVPYSRGFVARDENYYGASLLAYVRLAKKKNYRLVGCNRYGTNSVFLRNDVAGEIFPEVPIESCFESARARSGVAARRPKALLHDWVPVE